jgi:hypothetical protein
MTLPFAVTRSQLFPSDDISLLHLPTPLSANPPIPAVHPKVRPPLATHSPKFASQYTIPMFPLAFPRRKLAIFSLNLAKRIAFPDISQEILQLSSNYFFRRPDSKSVALKSIELEI